MILILTAFLTVLPDFAVSTSSRFPEIGTFEGSAISSSLLRLGDWGIAHSGVYSTKTPTERFFQLLIFDFAAAAYLGDAIHITGKGLRAKEFGATDLRYRVYLNSPLMGWQWREPTLSYVPERQQSQDELLWIASAGFEANYLSADYLSRNGHAMLYLYNRFYLPVLMLSRRDEVMDAETFFNRYREGDELISYLLLLKDGDHGAVAGEFDRDLLMVWLHEALNTVNWRALKALWGYVHDGRPPLVDDSGFAVSTSYIPTPYGFQGIYEFGGRALRVRLRVSDHRLESFGLLRHGRTSWQIEVFRPEGIHLRVERFWRNRFMAYVEGKTAGFVPGMPRRAAFCVGIGLKFN